MEHPRSAGHRKDRDLITGPPFVRVGPRSSRLKPRPATIPDKKCEPIRSTSRDYGIPTVPEGETTRVEELWFTNQMRVHHGNFLQIGNYVYGSSGDFGPAPLSAVDLATGEVVWRDRAFAKATLLLAGEQLIVLDEDGTLGLATVSPKGLEVQARAEIFSGRSWTAPTLVGTRLYMRDRKEMVALDLSR